MAPGDTQNVMMEDVRLVFKNFAGKEGKYNAEGDRNFGVIIPDQEKAEAMLADGWNIKYLKPREDDEEGEETPWLSVTVNFKKGRPPQIFLVTQEGRKRTPLTEQTVEQLDWAEIVTADLIVRPYNWDVNGNTGIKAYVQSLYVTIEEDPLMRKYSAMDEQRDDDE